MEEVGRTENGDLAIVECSQTDCAIRGTRNSPDGSVVLLPEFLHLLDPDRPEV